MSEVEAVLVAGFGGAVVGGVFALLGVVLTHRLRRRGKIHTEVKASWAGRAGTGYVESRNFAIKILNEREVGSALWNLRVVFYKDGKPLLTRTPMTANYRPDVLELPPQVTVARVFQLQVGTSGIPVDDDLTKAREADSIKLIADIPGEGEGAFEEDLPLWDRPETPSEGESRGETPEDTRPVSWVRRWFGF